MNRRQTGCGKYVLKTNFVIQHMTTIKNKRAISINEDMATFQLGLFWVIFAWNDGAELTICCLTYLVMANCLEFLVEVTNWAQTSKEW